MENFFKTDSLRYEPPKIEVMTVSQDDVICSSPEKGGEWGAGGDGWDIFG